MFSCKIGCLKYGLYCCVISFAVKVAVEMRESPNNTQCLQLGDGVVFSQGLSDRLAYATG